MAIELRRQLEGKTSKTWEDQAIAGTSGFSSCLVAQEISWPSTIVVTHGQEDLLHNLSTLFHPRLRALGLQSPSKQTFQIARTILDYAETAISSDDLIIPPRWELIPSGGVSLFYAILDPYGGKLQISCEVSNEINDYFIVFISDEKNIQYMEPIPIEDFKILSVQIQNIIQELKQSPHIVIKVAHEGQQMLNMLSSYSKTVVYALLETLPFSLEIYEQKGWLKEKNDLQVLHWLQLDLVFKIYENCWTLIDIIRHRLPIQKR